MKSEQTCTPIRLELATKSASWAENPFSRLAANVLSNPFERLFSFLQRKLHCENLMRQENFGRNMETQGLYRWSHYQYQQSHYDWRATNYYDTGFYFCLYLYVCCMITFVCISVCLCVCTYFTIYALNVCLCIVQKYE